MKFLRNLQLLATMLSIVFLVACVAQPIYNVDDAMIVSSTNKTLSKEDVKSAIIQAGTTRGWVIKENSPGNLVGTLFIRKHMAKIDIQYNEKFYSINYKDSENLSYQNTLIHKNYNNWVKNLQQDIEIQLNLMTLWSLVGRWNRAACFIGK